MPETKETKQVKKVENVKAQPKEKVDRTFERTDRFNRVAEGRTNKVINAIASLGRIPENKNNYIYTEEQILEIFENINTFVAETEQKFINSLGSDRLKERYKVKFTDK